MSAGRQLSPKQERIAKRVRWLKTHGYKRPRLTELAARITNLNLAAATVLLDKESGGGQNIFGCDHGDVGDRPPFCHQKVTLRRVAALRRSGAMNGIGATQLTWKGFVDLDPDSGDPKRLARRMRSVGIAWAARPFLNRLKGFSIFAGYLREGKGVEAAGTKYNGGADYGRDFATRYKRREAQLKKAGIDG